MNLYMIKWGNDFHDNYNYGTTMSFKENGTVHYAAPLMPPGISIKTWYSKTAYHAARNSPMLPILQAGQAYQIQLNATFDHPDAVQLVLHFYDENAVHLDRVLFQGSGGDFHFPENAVDYEVHLVNKKHEFLTFDSIIIADAPVLSDFEFLPSPKEAVTFVTAKHTQAQGVQLMIGEKRKFIHHFILEPASDHCFIFLNDFQEVDRVCIGTALFSFLLEQHKLNNPIEIVRGRNYEHLPVEGKQLASLCQLLLPNSQLTFSLSCEKNVLQRLEDRVTSISFAQKILREYTASKTYSD